MSCEHTQINQKQVQYKDLFDQEALDAWVKKWLDREVDEMAGEDKQDKKPAQKQVRQEVAALKTNLENLQRNLTELEEIAEQEKLQKQ